jgi:hypothetical protein
MAKFSPHYNLMKIVGKLSLFGQFVFWSILVLSFIPIVFKEFCEETQLINIVNILNIIGISLFFIIELVNDYVLIPQADCKRRDDFLDNSFGSTFSTKSSIEYYDNEEVNIGLYKVAVNLFENCFFSYSLLKSTTLRKIIIPSTILLLMSIFSYYGFKNVPIALSVLQALFSANILGSLVKHLILLAKLSTIQDSWIVLFQHADLKTNIDEYNHHVCRYWLMYEALHSRYNMSIPERAFKKLNPLLTAEWKEIKQKYNIN